MRLCVCEDHRDYLDNPQPYGSYPTGAMPAAGRVGKFGVFFGAFSVRAMSGQVVFQVGRSGSWRTFRLTPADPRVIAYASVKVLRCAAHRPCPGRLPHYRRAGAEDLHRKTDHSGHGRSTISGFAAGSHSTSTC